MNRRAAAIGIVLALAAVSPAQQDKPEQSGAVIRTETRVVLVDAVVTDKKGTYVRDLGMKDFKVWEDNKEQQIKSFSFEADPDSPTAYAAALPGAVFRQLHHRAGRSDARTRCGHASLSMPMPRPTT